MIRKKQTKKYNIYNIYLTLRFFGAFLLLLFFFFFPLSFVLLSFALLSFALLSLVVLSLALLSLLLLSFVILSLILLSLPLLSLPLLSLPLLSLARELLDIPSRGERRMPDPDTPIPPWRPLPLTLACRPEECASSLLKLLSREFNLRSS